MQDYKKNTDEEIVEIVCKKDKEVFREIIRRYEDKLRRYINSLIQDSNKIEDIL